MHSYVSSTSATRASQPAPIVDTEIETRVAMAWSRHFDNTPAVARELVQKIARDHGVALVGHFYSFMLREDDANKFLSHEMVEERLAALTCPGFFDPR